MEAEPCSDEKTEATFSSFSKSRRPSGLHMCRKPPRRSEMEGAPPYSRWYQPTHRSLQQNSSWLRDVSTHTGGPWDKPNRDSGKARWLVKGHSEDLPNISGSNYHRYMMRTLWVCPCVDSHVPFFLLINVLLVTLFSISLWEFISTNARPEALSQVTVPHSLVARVQGSHCHNLTSGSQGTEILLQVTAGWGHQILGGPSRVQLDFHCL